jgi:hypothetical protein
MKVRTQGLRRIEAGESPSVYVCNAFLHSCSQGFESIRVFGFSLLDQPKPFAQHFAGILVSPADDQLLNQLGLVLCQDNVSCRHDFYLQVYWHIMPTQTLPLSKE